MKFKFNNSALNNIKEAQSKAVKNAAQYVLGEANKTIPHQKGIMEQSGQVTSNNNTAAISYDTPYARRQHEDTRIRHKNGRRAKWLEHTLKENSSRIQTYIAEELRKAFK